MVDSEVAVATAYVDHYGRDVHYAAFVDNKEHVMGVLGAELRGVVRDRWLWLAGAAYQIDIISPDPNWLDEDIGNDFDAMVLRAGLGLRW